MNKKMLVILLVIFAFISTYGNDLIKENFTSDLKAYITAYNNEDWNQVTDFLYPKLFTLVPKESVIEGMSAKDDSGVTMKMSDIKVTKVSKPFNYKDEIFYILDYNLHLDFKLDSTLMSQKDTMKSMIISQYGKENVQHNKDTSHFSIKSKLQMIAISKDKCEKFHYLENAKGNDELLKALFEDDLIKLIKKNE